MSSSTKKVIYAALIGNTLIFITKFIAAFYSGSSAMLSEGIHSLVDTGNQGLLLYGLKKAKQPPDAQFPFGHGKEIYFWSFVVAILIFAVGAGVSVYEGIHHIIAPTPLGDPTLSFYVLGLAMLFEGAAWYFALREFTRSKGKWGFVEAVKRGKDPSMFVVLFEDSAAMLGLMVAFIGIGIAHYTGNPLYDGIASVVIGLILGGTAIWLAYETKSLLIGESANPELVSSIRDIVNQHSTVESINELLTMHMGPDFVLATMNVDFKDNLTAGELEQSIANMDCQIKQQHPTVKRVFIEAEAWSALTARHQ
ncbi:MAG: cation transporter [Cycloclasticus sp. symbiont of Poecilosclerida sp. M]|nr:MAG: cation transporter [Cycloclasticus sp. symbiont of Poecilosclerida sp. M]